MQARRRRDREPLPDGIYGCYLGQLQGETIIVSEFYASTLTWERSCP